MHTPGPWEARPNDGQIVLNGSNCYDIQEIYNDQGGFNPDDIRLMAAAPELLAALKQCLPLVDAYRRAAGGDGDVSAAFARSVIATAEGTHEQAGSLD